MSQTKSVIALFLVLFTQYAIASQDFSNLITVVGNGAVSKAPDAVIITVGVSAKNTDLKKLEKELDKKTAEILAFLYCQGIYENDIQTSNVDVQFDSKYYTASQSITFTLRKPSKYDEIIFGLFCAGIDAVESAVFIINNEDAQLQQARKLAEKDAFDIATLLAKELGVYVGKVYSTVELTSSTFYAGGFVVVTSSVQVQFYIDYKKYC